MIVPDGRSASSPNDPVESVVVVGSSAPITPSPSRSAHTTAPTKYPSIACPDPLTSRTLILKDLTEALPKESVAITLTMYMLSVSESIGLV